MDNKLIIRFNGRKIDELLVRHDAISIGRKIDNDIRLEDTTVSSHHAQLIRRGGDIYIKDLGSTNGTLLNGTQITESRLGHGDVVVIGKYTIALEQIDSEPLSLELDPTLQVGRQELEQLLDRLERAHITHTQSSISIDKKALNWIAQDENGVWWGFENKPVPGIHGWIDGLDGTKILLKQENGTNPQWRDTLQRLT